MAKLWILTLWFDYEVTTTIIGVYDSKENAITGMKKDTGENDLDDKYHVIDGYSYYDISPYELNKTYHTNKL